MNHDSTLPSAAQFLQTMNDYNRNISRFLDVIVAPPTVAAAAAAAPQQEQEQQQQQQHRRQESTAAADPSDLIFRQLFSSMAATSSPGNPGANFITWTIEPTHHPRVAAATALHSNDSFAGIREILFPLFSTSSPSSPSSPEMIEAALEDFIFGSEDSSTDNRTLTVQDVVCPISLEMFQRGNPISRIRGCGHCFHSGPLRRWLQSNSPVCPVCRFHLLTSSPLPTTTMPAQTTTTTTTTTTTPEDGDDDDDESMNLNTNMNMNMEIDSIGGEGQEIFSENDVDMDSTAIRTILSMLEDTNDGS
jgi:hypothetical protein